MSKKIYYIAHCRFPSERAHAIQIAQMAEALIATGLELELVVPNRSNAIKIGAKEYYGLKLDLPVKRLPILDLYRFGKIGYWLSGCSFMFSYFLFLLVKKIKGEQFLLYTIDMDQFSFLLVSFLGLPFYVEVHDSKKYGYVFGRMFRKAFGILTINSLIKKAIVKNFNLPPGKILVHPNGINLDRFLSKTDPAGWRKKFDIPPDVKVVLYTGKCYEWKGMDIFEAALKVLPPNFFFCFVGTTKEEVEAVTRKPFTYKNARFFGQRPHAEMPNWMAIADVAIVLGTKANEYSYYHTSPMKLFEYLAVGRPILASRTPAILDVVGEAEVFFYEPDNTGDLIRQIKEVVANKSLADAKSLSAKKLAPQFSWLGRAQAVKNYLKSAVGV